MRGRPPKVKGGLGEVLYVRATRAMIDRLDREARKLGVSRSDVVRAMIAGLS